MLGALPVDQVFFSPYSGTFQGYSVFATLPVLGALPVRTCATHASRLRRKSDASRPATTSSSSPTPNDRRAARAAPRCDVLGERQAASALPRRRRGAVIVRHG